MMMIVNKSRNGRINMTPATKSKIDTYDRYICDGIFEYLENADVINENQADSMESQMDSQRQSQMNKINTENNTPNQQNPQNNTGSGGDAKIGFWDWS
jgi:dsDNA-binding SOS-regulon protein